MKHVICFFILFTSTLYAQDSTNNAYNAVFISGGVGYLEPWVNISATGTIVHNSHYISLDYLGGGELGVEGGGQFNRYSVKYSRFIGSKSFKFFIGTGISYIKGDYEDWKEDPHKYSKFGIPFDFGVMIIPANAIGLSVQFSTIISKKSPGAFLTANIHLGKLK